jgi:hypothetical protein
MHIDEKKINEHRVTAHLTQRDIEEALIKKIAFSVKFDMDRNSIADVTFNVNDPGHSEFFIEAKVTLVNDLSKQPHAVEECKQDSNH